MAKVLGHGQLELVRRQLEVNEDVVDVHQIEAAVELDEPVSHLKHPAHASLQRLLHVDELLRVHHLVVRVLELAEDLEVLDVDARPLCEVLRSQGGVLGVLGLELVEQVHHGLAPHNVVRSAGHCGEHCAAASPHRRATAVRQCCSWGRTCVPSLSTPPSMSKQSYFLRVHAQSGLSYSVNMAGFLCEDASQARGWRAKAGAQATQKRANINLAIAGRPCAAGRAAWCVGLHASHHATLDATRALHARAGEHLTICRCRASRIAICRVGLSSLPHHGWGGTTQG